MPTSCWWSELGWCWSGLGLYERKTGTSRLSVRPDEVALQWLHSDSGQLAFGSHPLVASLSASSCYHLAFVELLSSAASVLVTQPLRVAATEQMVGSSGMGTLATLLRIVQRDGVAGLWKGVRASLLRRLAVNGVSFACRQLVAAAARRFGLYHPLAGAWADWLIVAASLLAHSALDVVECRLLVEQRTVPPTPLKYRHGLLHAVALITAEESAAALFAPVEPLLLLSLPWLAAVYALRHAQPARLPPRLYSCVSFVLLGALAHPFLLLAAQRSCNTLSLPPRCRSPLYFTTTLDCLRENVAANGLAGLWRGFPAALLASGVTSATIALVKSMLYRAIAHIPPPQPVT